MVEYGFRVPMTTTLCKDKECKSDIMIEPGILYEIEAEVIPKTPFSPSDIPSKLYAVLQAIRKKYPGVIITYLGISEDGKKVTIQLYDAGQWYIGCYCP